MFFSININTSSLRIVFSFIPKNFIIDTIIIIQL